MFNECLTSVSRYYFITQKQRARNVKKKKKREKKNGPGLCCVTTRICDVVARTQGGLGKGKAVTDSEKKVPPRSHSQNK